MKSIFFLTLTACLALTLTVCLEAQTTPAPPVNPAQIGRDMGHGVNLGNALESPQGEGKWGVTLQESYFAAIEQVGFTLVRVPICWPAHALSEAPYTVDPAFFQRVDWVVAQAKAHHLHAILDFHNYGEMMKDPASQEERFLGIWKQVAEHYQSEPSTILFELLNEPNGKFDAPTWNALLVKALAVMRPSNPTRLIVVGGVHWNSIGALSDLVLPDDDHNLVVTFHYYDPMKFTHQGASWIKGSASWLGTTWEGTDAEKQTVDQAMDKAAAWGQTHQRPIYLGEFGSFNKADIDSRARWTQCVARSAEAHGFAWTYWEFCSGFGVYDPVVNQWRAPLLQALAPDAKP